MKHSVAQIERETIWVCQACGKTAKVRYDFNDASCYVNSVECWADSLVYDANGQLRGGQAVPQT